MIRERADWCISRQRRWGLPIPVFYCKDCGKPVCTDETIEAVSKLFGEKGSQRLVRARGRRHSCPKASPARTAAASTSTKETDTLDGWFDSGSTHFAVHAEAIRASGPRPCISRASTSTAAGSSRRCSTAVGALGKGAPLQECVTHGWTVDGEGKAMHKSLGNGVDPADVVQRITARTCCRLWAGICRLPRRRALLEGDLQAAEPELPEVPQHRASYCLDNLDGFDAEHLVAPEDMLELDRWAITKLNELIASVAETAYHNYEFHVVSHAINDFCVVDALELLSRHHQGPPLLRGRERRSRAAARRPPCT